MIEGLVVGEDVGEGVLVLDVVEEGVVDSLEHLLLVLLGVGVEVLGGGVDEGVELAEGGGELHGFTVPSLG